MPHFLYGPADDDTHFDRFLRAPVGSGRWAVFDARTPSWDAAVASIRGGPPDGILVWTAYASVPAWVWVAPVPVIALAPDANLQWHSYRSILPRADLILTDTPSADRLRRAGLPFVRAANLFGLDRHFVAALDDPEGERDIDVLFIGNLNPAVQSERLPWLGRLASLADRCTVAIRTGVFGAEYRALLRRAKLVFNRSVRGECNLRALEAAASGAVLLQEAENDEVKDYLEPGIEYAPYSDADLEAVVARFLGDEPARRAIADAARDRARWWTFDALVEAAVGVGGKRWGEVRERALARGRSAGPVPLAGRVWQRAALVGPDADPGLGDDLAAASDRHALGALAPSPTVAAPHLAVAAAAGNRVSAVGHATALAELGRVPEAVGALKAALTTLEADPGLTAAEADSVPYPVRFDGLRVGWERAGYDHPDDPTAEHAEKGRLLRAGALALLAEWTRDLDAYRAAADAEPGSAAVQAALGCALARSGRFAEAAGHLDAAAVANPFDRAVARTLVRARADMGDETGAGTTRATLRRLSRAAPNVFPLQPWFADEPAPAPSDAAPTGTELASLIVLCCNEVEVTRLCAESVLRHTRAPYELVFVDNGSTDETAAYLDTLKSRPGPVRVVVVRNAENRGYPAGVNQGLAVARGEYLVLLNNDVVVTPGWLNRLVRCSLHNWPSVGLTGAVTNYAPPPQLVEPGYTDLGGLDAFASRRAGAFAGQALPVPRLTGFCLLVRRAVFDAIGRLDEGFGLGFFDDDDLCLRARHAGFRLALTLDCYVHHFGSRTFRGLGIDTTKQLEDNLALYRAKWGEEEAARYSVPVPPAPRLRLPAPGSPTFAPAMTLRADKPQFTTVVQDAPRVTVSAVAKRKPRKSLTMIVKNEEENLPACLTSARDLVDEAVVMDTGSTDRTVEIAKSFGCVVGSFPWIDHFAAARNAALDLATGDYAFWMDADDRLDDENRGKLKTLFANLTGGNEAFVMKCLCVADRPGAGATAVDHVRLFRLHPAHRWTHRVHEQILPSLRATGAEVRWSDVAVRHVGYIDPSARRGKLARDLRLLHLADADEPGHPFTLFNLGSVYHELGDFAAATSVLEKSLAGSHPTDSIVRKTYALLARCHRLAGDRNKAEATCRRGRQHYPDDAELVFLAAGFAREAGDLGAAEGLYRKLIDGSEDPHFASVDTGLRAVKGRHNLAVLLLEQGRLAEAEGLWRAALTHDPYFLPAQVGLGEVCVKAGNEAGFARQVAALEEMGEAGAAEVAVLRARWKGERGDRAGAAAALEEAIARMPGVLGLRVALSHARIAADSAPNLLEAAFRGVLELDPQNTQAKRNLEVLYHKTGRSIEGVLDGSGSPSPGA